MIVRSHPAYIFRDKGLYKRELDEIKGFANANKDYVYLDIPEVIKRMHGFEFTYNDHEFQHQLIRNCDVLITNFSTLMLEATIFDNKCWI